MYVYLNADTPISQRANVGSNGRAPKCYGKEPARYMGMEGQAGRTVEWKETMQKNRRAWSHLRYTKTKKYLCSHERPVYICPVCLSPMAFLLSAHVFSPMGPLYVSGWLIPISHPGRADDPSLVDQRSYDYWEGLVRNCLPLLRGCSAGNTAGGRTTSLKKKPDPWSHAAANRLENQKQSPANTLHPWSQLFLITQFNVLPF